jgi:hypothetical protein
MAYIDGRQKYSRPQGMVWSDTNDIYDTFASEEELPLVTSDHNRSPIDVKPIRIETRDRMVNGRMRSYHTADKISISCSWDMLPSRGFAANPNFDLTTGAPQNALLATYTANPRDNAEFQYTVDGGAGGVELLDWYETHTGSFWVFLAYDKYNNFSEESNPYAYLNVYNEGIEMYISSFSYSVAQRGANNFDYWNISVTLEEV